ncbi:hypothetical protein PsorP6_011394 [Peronosclerospora sorghi]|uniref:Uncharacterized protein n=1 Tax=Peronosclerospora sorghi TaxID=230839 RepID=A0ACC0WJF0_9STRA|nr:hypothetical protein PsorP6_011394 [Peronosclerospora sorghi]
MLEACTRDPEWVDDLIIVLSEDLAEDDVQRDVRQNPSMVHDYALHFLQRDASIHMISLKRTVDDPCTTASPLLIHVAGVRIRSISSMAITTTVTHQYNPASHHRFAISPRCTVASSSMSIMELNKHHLGSTKMLAKLLIYILDKSPPIAFQQAR